MKTLTASEIVSLLEAPQDLDAIIRYANEEDGIHPDHAINLFFRANKKGEKRKYGVMPAYGRTHYYS